MPPPKSSNTSDITMPVHNKHHANTRTGTDTYMTDATDNNENNKNPTSPDMTPQWDCSVWSLVSHKTKPQKSSRSNLTPRPANPNTSTAVTAPTPMDVVIDAPTTSSTANADTTTHTMTVAPPDSLNTRTVAPTTPNSTAATTPPKWTPIKIGWNSVLPVNHSIHDPNPTSSPVDDAKTSQHPFIAKLSSFISSASKTHDSPIAIKTSRSKCILQPKDLHPYWSVNDFKNHFAYTTTNRRVQFTLWISMPSSLTLWTLKQPILGHL